LHFLDGVTGVKDFDVWSFFPKHPDGHIPRRPVGRSFGWKVSLYGPQKRRCVVFWLMNSRHDFRHALTAALSVLLTPDRYMNNIQTKSYRCFQIASLASGLFAAVTIVLWLVTLVASPQLPLTRHFNLGVWKGFSGEKLGMLVVFNDSQYGPYRGSIVALSDDKHPPKFVWLWRIGENYEVGKQIIFDGKGAIQVTAIGADFPGIYYRHFQWPNTPQPLWTLMVSLLYPLFVFSVLPSVWILRRWHLWTRLRRDAKAEINSHRPSNFVP
jgi:hypothetical protein